MKKFVFLPLALAVMFMFITTSCSDDDSDETCDFIPNTSPETCDVSSVSFCSDGENSYLVVNDENGESNNFICDGDDCDDAYNEVYNYLGCLNGESSVNLNSPAYIAFKSMSLKVIAEARAAAGCN